MVERIAAPVIPPSTGQPLYRERACCEHSAASRLPLAEPPDQPFTLVGVVYGMGRVDSSGRVSDRSITACLGWRPGERLTLTATTAGVIARRDPVGMVTLPRKPYIVIPAVLRHRCGMAIGDRVLLAATPDEDTLAVYPLAVVHRAIRDYHNTPDGGDRP